MKTITKLELKKFIKEIILENKLTERSDMRVSVADVIKSMETASYSLNYGSGKLDASLKSKAISKKHHKNMVKKLDSINSDLQKMIQILTSEERLT